jgi:hypothetical protein
MRSWQRDLAIADAKMRAEYYRILIEVNKLPAYIARYHAELASIETMQVHILYNEGAL